MAPVPAAGQKEAYIYKDMFVFACYAGGLRFGDVISLRWENINIKEKRYMDVIGKTVNQHSFKIPNIAFEIIFIL